MLFLKYRVVTISFILSNLRYFKVKQDFAVVIQSLTHVWFWDSINCSTQAFPVFSLSLWLCSNSCPLRQPCHPTISSSVAPFSSCPQSFPHQSLSNILALCIMCPKYWSFNFNISLPNEYSGLISFKMDWFDLLCCPRDFRESSSAPQLESISSSVLSCLYDSPVTPMCD